MFKYYCLNNIATEGLRKFSALYERTEDMDQADGILVRSAKMHDMEFSDNLLAIARAGAGVNNIPLDRCAEKGIVVFNTPGANANGVKELVFAGMLLASRDIVEGVDWVRANWKNPNIAKVAEKEKKQFAGTEIRGKKLGIIGLGAIGVRVANAAIDLGMEIYGYDPYVSVDAAWNLNRSVKHVTDVKEIYELCDFITIHVPALPSTKNMINKDAIDMMKDGVILINMARDSSRPPIWALPPRSPRSNAPRWLWKRCRTTSRTATSSTVSTIPDVIWASVPSRAGSPSITRIRPT